MQKCLLCERYFDQSEIDKGVPIEHARRNTLLLTRFPNGNLHQFKIEKEQKTQIPKGAVVVPPPAPVEAPPEVAAPESPGATQDVEALAQALESHFHPDLPVQSEPSGIVEPSDTTDDTHDDSFTECVVVWLKSDLPSGKLPFGIVRPHGAKRGGRDGYLFKFDDIVTDGMETIRIGSRVRGRVVDAELGKESKRLIEIEVYKED